MMETASEKALVRKEFARFLKSHYAEVHRMLKRRYGTRKPIYFSKLNGTVRAMYPHERAVAALFDSYGDSQYLTALIAANVLMHGLGVIESVSERPDYCSGEWYRVKKKLPQRKVRHILHVYCKNEKSVTEVLDRLGKYHSINVLDDQILYQLMPADTFKYQILYHFPPSEEKAAWQTFAIAKRVPETLSRLTPESSELGTSCYHLRVLPNSNVYEWN